MVNLDSNLEQIFNSYHENHLSHAFLIETNNQERCFKDLKLQLCKINCNETYQENCDNCNLCHLLNTEQLPSFIVIRPDGSAIKKEQVLELKQKFSTMPIYSKYNIYAILNSEKLNSSSANTLLKFIEEPERGIIGFFITNNKENIIDTIRSRCQIISNFYEESKVLNEDVFKSCIDYLKNVHISKDYSLFLNRDFLQDFSYSREDFILFFQYLIEIYYVLYQCSIRNISLEKKYEDLAFLLKKDSVYFLNQLKLVEELEKELSYNVNINLLLDRFVLETRSQ